MGAVATGGGSTFATTCSVEVVTSTDSAPASEIDTVLTSVVTGSRGRALRAQLAAMHPAQAREEIDDAIQTACGRFIDVTDGIAAPGQVYAWIRITAHRVLSREDDRLARQVPTDPTTDELDAIAASAPGPAEQVIDREDEGDLTTLARSVAAELPLQRQRDVLALYGAGYKRSEIAAHLGVRERTVKRDLLEILDRTRGALARLAGGGCDTGEPLIVRFACGITSPVEESQAQLHLACCQRCTEFHERLHLWREKVGAILPIPATAHADPGVLERTLHKSLDGVNSVRQYVTDGGTQIKQQVATTYSMRVADPTPLAGARPGAVAAVVAGCVAASVAAYTCVDKTIEAVKGKDQPADRADTKPKRTRAAQVQPVEPTPQPAPVEVEPTPQPAPAAEPPPPPPPSPYQGDTGFTPSSSVTPSASAPQPATPAPVVDGTSSEFQP